MEKKVWVVAADMGYGHQRAAYPLKDIAYDGIINANSDKMISPQEKKIWNSSRSFYEWISRRSDISPTGKFLFDLFDKLQKIDPYYPRAPNTKPGYAVKYLEKRIKKGLCRGLIKYIEKKDIPLVTTFYIPAIAANFYKLPKIYCVITDTDMHRVWVPKDSSQNKIIYLAPCQHAVNRLISYGVKQKQIILTGFPLPKECIGENSEIAKKALARRIVNLDPKGIFIKSHLAHIESILGSDFKTDAKSNPPTITFVVGGAGAQKEIGSELMISLSKKIAEKKIRFVLVAGTHLDVKQYFEDEAEKAGLKKYFGKSLIIFAEMKKKDYFEKFSKILNETDILITKPSEMSFYAALGIPLVILPPIGAHEGWNRKWLSEIGAGIDIENPRYASDWIEEWLSDGRLAMRALNGFIRAPRMGTYEIEKTVLKE
jgi:hypothetical protein